MLKLEHYISYALGSNCAKYEVSSFISLQDMVKTHFCNVGGTTGGGCTTWCPYCGMSLAIVWGVTVVTVPNIKSLALLVSEIPV